MAGLCTPKNVFWCDGSSQEHDALTQLAVAEGVLIALRQDRLPGCFYHRSSPNDVARVEQCTYICTPTREEAGPTNNWESPEVMRDRLHDLCRGAMRDRTMYVIPYLMGPTHSPLAKVGVELTDSLYVVLSMRIMTRMGSAAFERLGAGSDFNRGLHCMLDVNPERRIIAHFPRENAIISAGSNYGGNVLLGKKCLALRIGSYLGRHERWLAEHMLILGVESPEGEKTYVAAAFPSACGKTNFAMLIPPESFDGWKVRTIGDDIAWMKPGSDGRLRAINPEAGYFGVVPGTNGTTNPNAIKTIARDTIFTNVALTPELDVWWEGKDNPPPAHCTDWQGQPWTPDSTTPAAHPNSRFAAPMRNNPVLAAEVNAPNGVPISAIIFGGRRASTMPLVFQTFDWVHGVFTGATMGSETTAASVGAVGKIRRDPMAMLPFCGYNMNEYLAHWLRMGEQLRQPPLVFHVNWFRKDASNNFLWPGYSENMRVLKWIVDRCKGTGSGVNSPLGWIPTAESLNLNDLPGMNPERFEELMKIDPDEWRREMESLDELFSTLGSNLPRELVHQREQLAARLELS